MIVQFLCPPLPVVMLIASAALVSCRGADSRSERDIKLVQPRELANRSIDTTTLQSAEDTTQCLHQLPARVVARGRLRKEVHLGPPGYGETPEQDRRDTILVLVVSHPIPVCADPERGDTAGAVLAQALQLVYAPRNGLEHIGETVMVFGGLEEAVFGWHYTNVVLHVDSIPQLRVSRPKAHTTVLRSGLGVRIVAAAPNKRLKLAARVD